ncbi:ABC transporter ATP-binding protein [Algihabitans albus]|uniref:ABC transporter ATP-binding protein n=1 Tax=Algihabitans albus TaxID=2164067 RepID=UPI000E5C6047|nr:ABC transporter ATP-binding protein [Algihabitans albus]
MTREAETQLSARTRTGIGSAPLLQVDALRGGYGGKPVLQEVGFSVGRGEIVAIIGRNGVGKTTLMRSLIGLMRADAGSIRFEGKEIGSLPADRRARLGLGYIPQGREVFPRMTVRENLQVGETLSAAGSDPDYQTVYDFFPVLRQRARQRAGTLSGGQQQQLAIGRVMVGRPKLMLLDEPSEGIQPSIVQDIGRAIKKLNASQGLTVLFVEQNLDMIQSMAQRGYVMDKGRIVAELDVEELHDRERVRRYLSV